MPPKSKSILGAALAAAMTAILGAAAAHANSSCQRDEVAVANAGRVSPSETQLFGLLCD